jgi:2'-5' RNA ligase
MFLDNSYIIAELPDLLSDEIISWCYDQVEDSCLYINGDQYGRVHDVHVTVLSNLKKQSIRNIKQSIVEEGLFNCILGDIKLFTTNSKFDVLYVEITNNDIIDVNKKLSKNIDFDNFYSFFIPHVTICYMKKGIGEKFLGNKYFNGKSFNVRELIYSSPENQIKFSLGDFK